MEAAEEGSGSSSVHGKKASNVGRQDGGDAGHTSMAEGAVVEMSPTRRYGRCGIVLGKGAHKTVWRAFDFEEHIEVAWNSLQIAKQESSDFVPEIEILKKIRHPNIIALRDFWYGNGTFVFITELMVSGSLKEYTKMFKGINTRTIRWWSRQVLYGLNYLHSQNPPVIHRDIKSDNIFINGHNGVVKIGDMGTAKIKDEMKCTLIGTPEFMAPEMYDEKGYSEKIDIYALGMCILELSTGEYPYSECKNAAQIYKKVLNNVKPECLSRVEDEDLLSLINACISPESSRPSASELFDHPFYAVDPEVTLMAVNAAFNTLTLQVVLRGTDKISIKFEYNMCADTTEDVVREMIEESVIPERYRSVLCFEIDNLIRHFCTMVPLFPRARSDHRVPDRLEVKMEIEDGKLDRPILFEGMSVTEGVSGCPTESPQQRSAGQSPNFAWKRDAQYKRELDEIQKEMDTIHRRALKAEQRVRDMEDNIKVERGKKTDAEGVIKLLTQEISYLMDRGDSAAGYRGKDDQGSGHSDTEPGQMQEMSPSTKIEHFVMDAARTTNRNYEKVTEWIARLKEQDITTVGDLMVLHEVDWGRLNLTVLAYRVLKNAIATHQSGTGAAVGKDAAYHSGTGQSVILSGGVGASPSTGPNTSPAGTTAVQSPTIESRDGDKGCCKNTE